MDFTITSYKFLLNTLIKAEFNFQTFAEFLHDSKSNSVILRHDVDLLPQNSLRFAKIQAELGIKGSYYFRAVPESWDENIIKEIAALGHEVGYHYENMDVAFQRIISNRKVSTKELNNLINELKAMSNVRRINRASHLTSHPSPLTSENLSPLTSHLLESAYEDFCVNSEKLRRLVPVSTICMHGSPRSKFDNKVIWDKYDYKKLGIIGEPYYDVDFDKVFYLTDTGRRWDGWKTSVRDKVPQQELWSKQGLVFHSTQDIINAINAVYQFSNKLKSIPFTDHPLVRGKDVKRNGFFNQTPNTKQQITNIEQQSINTEQPTPNNQHQILNNIMFTMHPQRWHNSTLPWVKELLMQNIKNQIKKALFVK